MEDQVEIDNNTLCSISYFKKNKFNIDWTKVSLVCNFSYEFFKCFEDVLDCWDIINFNLNISEEVREEIAREAVMKILEKL
jgi:hypothetical protein